MTIIEQLKAKYDPIDYTLPLENPDTYFLEKYESKIGENWYGFSLGAVPVAWKNIIDEFLQYLREVAPDFKILQIKTKFGSVRFHVDLNIDNVEVNKELYKYIKELQDWLGDKSLVY